MSTKVNPTPTSKKKSKPKPMSLGAFYAEVEKTEPPKKTAFDLLANNGMIDPSKVSFGQSSAGSKYQEEFIVDGQKINTVEEHAELLKINKTALNERTPAIEIVFYKECMMCVTGNRRLWAHKKAGKPIPYTKLDMTEKAISQHANVDPEAPRSMLTLR